MGAAASVALTDSAKGKAELKSVYENTSLVPAYRAQAGYLLALMEKAAGNAEAAKTILKAVGSNASFGMYSRIAEQALSEM